MGVLTASPSAKKSSTRPSGSLSRSSRSLFIVLHHCHHTLSSPSLASSISILSEAKPVMPVVHSADAQGKRGMMKAFIYYPVFWSK